MNDVDVQRLGRLQERLGVRFKDLELLDQSLVHRSLLRDPGFEGRESNERLEFLGDAIIGAVVARYLYDRLPAATEGDLTLLRTWLVRASTLADWARELELDTFVRLGRSDESTSRRTKLMARTFEAVVGAIYLERGVRGVTAFLRPFVTRELKTRFAGPTPLDAKSRLQQVSQSRFEEVPTYHVVEVTGPGHDPQFSVEVRVGPSLVRAGTGGTKQEAEQAAARQALEYLETMTEAAAEESSAPEEADDVAGDEALSAPDTLD